MQNSRRNILKLGGLLTLMPISAFNFGCSIKPFIRGKNKKIAIIYATRYGATKDTAYWIAEGLEKEVDLLNIEDISFLNCANKYDLFIIGSGVWTYGVDKKLLRFLDTQKSSLQEKIVASFIVCGTTKKSIKGKARIEKYFSKFHVSLDKKPILNEYFGGRIIIDKLNKRDKKALEIFYEKILKREFVSWDKTQPNKAGLFGKKLGNI